MVSNRCKQCKYVSTNCGTVLCDYLLIALTPRQCPAGDACTKFEERKDGTKTRIPFEG